MSGREPILVVTGEDDGGRSVVVRRIPAGDEPVPVLSLEGPATLRPSASDAQVLGATVPGASDRVIVTWPRGHREPRHRTETIDVDVVLRGEVDVVLDAETVRLEAGDCVVLPGTAHGWAVGPEGAVVLITLTGATVAPTAKA